MIEVVSEEETKMGDCGRDEDDVLVLLRGCLSQPGDIP